MLTGGVIYMMRRPPSAAASFGDLALTDTKKSLWVSPQMVRIGTIGDVANSNNNGIVQCSGGSSCAPNYNKS